MMNIISLDSHFTHRLRGQEGSNSSNYGAVKTCKDNCVSNIESSIDKNNIDGCTVTFDNLDFKDRALELFLFLQLVLEVCLAKVGDERNQIGKTFTSDGWSWAEWDIRLRVIILPIEAGIDTFLSKC